MDTDFKEIEEMGNLRKKVVNTASIDIGPTYLPTATFDVKPIHYGVLIESCYMGTGIDLRIKFNRNDGSAHNVSFSSYGFLCYYDSTERLHTLILKRGSDVSITVTYDDQDGELIVEQKYIHDGEDHNVRSEMHVIKVGRYITDIEMEDKTIMRLKVPGGML